MRSIAAMLLSLVFAMTTYAATKPAPAPKPVDLDALTKDQSIDGFRVTALYLNDADHAMGARFVHEKSGFTLDYLQIESLPQGYTWVNSFPVSDQGEPQDVFMTAGEITPIEPAEQP